MSSTTSISPPAGEGRASVPTDGRERFLAACAARPVSRPPVWLMRQAGRALPEYRALKETHSFVELVQTPELAAEVTLQPIRRFGFDAAILFSDILVVPEAMGQAYHFREGGGVAMEFVLRGAEEIDRLDPDAVVERLDYGAQALRLIKRELQDRTALLGFAGSPWTLANFMLEGGSAREFTRAKALFYTEPALYARLAEKLSRAVLAYLRLQIAAGADAVQIFDSLAGSLAEHDYEAASGRWIREIVAGLGGAVPAIVFARGYHADVGRLVDTGAQVLGFDWNLSLPGVRMQVPGRMAVQGNLDPFLLTTSVEVVSRETRRLLEAMRGRPGHIFNLGHGLPPQARLECIESLVRTVQEFA